MASTQGSSVDILRKNKMKLVRWLSADVKWILLNLPKDIADGRTYQRLKNTTQPEDACTDLIDIVMAKGEGSSSDFLQLLKDPEFHTHNTYPELKEWILSLDLPGPAETSRPTNPSAAGGTPRRVQDSPDGPLDNPHVDRTKKIMLSYQWDNQVLVERVYNRLTQLGWTVWMDIKGGVEGNINAAIAAGVEGAMVICPFMTPKYQESHNCTKELNYADVRKVTIVPILVAKDWKPTSWLGLIIAGKKYIKFTEAASSDDEFDERVKELDEELRKLA